MYIVHVSIQVKQESVDAFRAATIENARNSVQEPGIARFDFLADNDSPTHFMLIEVYHTPADAVSHKQTAHYEKWRDTVASMMAAPRTSIKYANLFPDDSGWE